jgi:glyoxylase-like metal-dependent hydrolase (beta-lactamase superfamily II)
MKLKWLGCVLLLRLAALDAQVQPDFKLQPVGDRVWAAISSDSGKAFADAGFVIGDDGVLVVDTFQDPEPARELLAEIRKLTPLPVRFVVNTHYHIDHVNGDDVFAEAGAAIVAHRNVRTWLRKENFKFWPEPAPADVKARLESLTLPNIVYDDRVDIYLGRRLVEVRYYPGHTGGDSVVLIPDANVVFCGDLTVDQALSQPD